MAKFIDEKDAMGRFCELLAEAERGATTIITKRGRPVAELAPANAISQSERQPSFLDLAGSGRGLWCPDSTATIRAMRDEWER